MKRFAVGGFQHETNTFAATKAVWPNFVEPDFWPGFTKGDRLVQTFDGLTIPIAGAIAELMKAGHAVVPLTWCAAAPSAYIEDSAFEAISDELLGSLRSATNGMLDGDYLDLHGAAVTESHDDAEGELLRRVRSLIGPDVPIAVSLDLH